MRSFPPAKAAVLVLAFAIAVPAEAGSPADFPFLGSYGDPTSKWGCNSARKQTEGDYMTFGRKDLFIHTQSCAFVSWSRVGPDGFDIVQRCLKAKPYTERFRITAGSVHYRGKLYQRCAA